MELKIGQQARGTRILALDKAAKFRQTCDGLAMLARSTGAEEIVLPSVEPLALHTGTTNAAQIYSFTDAISGDMLCLRPSTTPTIVAIAKGVWKNRVDVKLFYITRCWRYEAARYGHHREFTVFGYEIINPRTPALAQGSWLMDLARRVVSNFTPSFVVTEANSAFRIMCPGLSATQSQVCIGGPHERGFGFSVMVDRLMLL